jgi:hypothetical protein
MVEKITAREQAKRSICSTILLALVLIFLFIVPAFPSGSLTIIYNILLTVILVFAALSMDRARKKAFVVAVLAIAFEWVAYFLDLSAILSLSQVVLFLYFILIVVGMIIQIATTRQVTARVIVESITGYLLLGIVFSTVIMVLVRNYPGAYLVGGAASSISDAGWQLSESIYYGFITFTTLGYGDIIPLVPLSRSIAVLASVTGQIYLTVIIAMLVGKFLSSRQES